MVDGPVREGSRMLAPFRRLGRFRVVKPAKSHESFETPDFESSTWDFLSALAGAMNSSQAKLGVVLGKLEHVTDKEMKILSQDLIEECFSNRQAVWPSENRDILFKLLSMREGEYPQPGSYGRQKLAMLSMEDLIIFSRGVFLELERRQCQPLASFPIDATDAEDSSSIPGPSQQQHYRGRDYVLQTDIQSSMTNTPWLSKTFSQPPQRQMTGDSSNSVMIIGGKPFSKASAFCLDGRIVERSKYVVGWGGYSDIWTGKLEGRTVAIKVLRGFSAVETLGVQSKLTKRIWREYLAWSSLSHPNVLPCLGFSYDFALECSSEVPALVSPWMSNGSVWSYIQSHPETDKISLIVGITQGLLYLHTRVPVVVHGDIRAGNILVSDEGVPRFTDFGLSRVHHDDLALTTTSEAAGSLRWMAPELFNDVKVNEASDVWAFGMTILEILTVKRPYFYVSMEPAVLRLIVNGCPPLRPNLEDAPVLTEEIWQICIDTWRPEAKDRPSMQVIASKIINEKRYQEWSQLRLKQRGANTREKRTASEPLQGLASKRDSKKQSITWRRSTRTWSSSLWEF